MSCSMARQHHARRADDLVHAEVPEEDLVARVVDARDGARHVEVVLGHLADDEVVGVIAGHRGHDAGPVGARLGEVRALAAVTVDDHRAQLVADALRAARVLLHEHQLMALGQQLLGQVEADAAATDDDHEHVSVLPSRRPCRLVRLAGRQSHGPLRAGRRRRPRDVRGARHGRPAHEPPDGVDHHHRPVDRVDAERGVGLRAHRVVDLADDVAGCRRSWRPAARRGCCGCRRW